MRWRWLGVVAGALLVLGVASDASAQRRDRDRDRDWTLLGEKSVGFRVDRDVIRISHPEDWYRDRSFRRLHLVAEGNDIHLMGVRLVYFNGFGEDYRVDRLLRDGDDQVVELRGDRRFLRQIELTYRSRPGFGGQAVMKVYGEQSRRGPDGPPPIGPGADRDRGDRDRGDRDRGDRDRGDRDRDWTELGCQRVSLFGRDRDSIRVGRREGRFKSIRLHVRGADVEILDARVIYANGAPDDVQVKHFLRQGERTRPLDLRGWERSIDRVELTYRTVPNFKGLATVCVEGLQ